MKRALCLLLSLSLLLALMGCGSDKPEVDNPVAPVEDVPNRPNEEPDPVPRPVDKPDQLDYDQTVKSTGPEEFAIGAFTGIINPFIAHTMVHSPPDLELESEETLDALREWIDEVNETEPMFLLDPNNIYLYSHGYRLKMESPLDWWGNNVYIWFELVDYNWRCVMQSVGEDGEAGYNGYGIDYTETGFGDDDVRVVEIQF